MKTGLYRHKETKKIIGVIGIFEETVTSKLYVAWIDKYTGVKFVTEKDIFEKVLESYDLIKEVKE